MSQPVLFVIDDDAGVVHALRDDLSRRKRVRHYGAGLAGELGDLIHRQVGRQMMNEPAVLTQAGRCHERGQAVPLAGRGGDDRHSTGPAAGRRRSAESIQRQVNPHARGSRETPSGRCQLGRVARPVPPING